MSGIENNLRNGHPKHSDTWKDYCLKTWQSFSTYICGVFSLEGKPQPLIFTWVFPVVNAVVFTFMSGEYQCWINVQVNLKTYLFVQVCI